jgi:hypothetical protein
MSETLYWIGIPMKDKVCDVKWAMANESTSPKGFHPRSPASAHYAVTPGMEQELLRNMNYF